MNKIIEKLKETMISEAPKGVYYSSYGDEINCLHCGIQKKLLNVDSNNIYCPICKANNVITQFHHAQKQTLVITKEKDKYIFHFIEGYLTVSAHKTNFFKSEDFIVEINKVNNKIRILKETSDSKFSVCDMRNISRIISKFGFDCIKGHNFLFEDDFIKSLSFLYDDNVTLFTVFSKLISLNNVTKKSPVFKKALPDDKTLFSFNKCTSAEHFINPNDDTEMWCGNCGKYIKHNVRNTTTYCSCGATISNTKPNWSRESLFYLDYEDNEDSVIFRYTPFDIHSVVDEHTAISGLPARTIKTVITKTPLLAVIYKDGIEFFTNSEQTILDYRNILNTPVNFSYPSDNEILNNIGFYDFIDKYYLLASGPINILSYFSGFKASENSKYFVDCGLSQIIPTFIDPNVAYPKFILQKTKNTPVFSEEQIVDFKEHPIFPNNFRGYIKCYSKDKNLLVSDYDVLIKCCSQKLLLELLSNPLVTGSTITEYIKCIANKEYIAPAQTFLLLSEYIALAKSLNYDLSNPDILLPENLTKMLNKVKFENNFSFTNEQAIDFQNAASKISFESENENIFIKPFRSISDLIEAKKQMSNFSPILNRSFVNMVYFGVYSKNTNKLLYFIEAEITLADSYYEKGKITRLIEFGNESVKHHKMFSDPFVKDFFSYYKMS